MTRQQNKNTIIDTQDNMMLRELSNPTIVVGPERFSITEAQDNNLNIATVTCSWTLKRPWINPLMTLEKWK